MLLYQSADLHLVQKSFPFPFSTLQTHCNTCPSLHRQVTSVQILHQYRFIVSDSTHALKLLWKCENDEENE
jgi:hypothetical protein